MKYGRISTSKPPALEALMRGKAGRVFGALMSLLTMLKGLPLAYHKDLLEDHEPLFDSVDTILSCLGVANAIIGGLRINSEAMARAIGGDACVADQWCEETGRRYGEC